MHMSQHSFSKHERLSSEKAIQELFEKGSSFSLYPFRVKILTQEHESNHSVLITVSKRFYKRAVDRNIIKRRTREAYRLSKHFLLQEGKSLHIAFIYIGKEINSFELIQKKLSSILQRIQNERND